MPATRLWTAADFAALGGGAQRTLPEWADLILAGGGGGLTAEEVRDLVAAFVVAGSNMTVTHNDGADTLTFASTGGGGSLASLGWINVKDAPYNAVGDNVTDDTAAIQAAIDAAFGTAGSPNTTANPHLNKVLYFPPGRFIVTEPIRFTHVYGGRVIGAGRHITKIINITGGESNTEASAVITQGYSYGRFEGISFVSSGTNSSCFDLSWLGETSPGTALQSNTFIDCFFSGGGYGLAIGGNGWMGSETLILNCFMANQTIAGLSVWNYNAVQTQMIGGNIQNCAIGAAVYNGGALNCIHGVGFQLNGQDIEINASAQDAMSIAGCRTESFKFVKILAGQKVAISGCNQITPNMINPETRFLHQIYGMSTINACSSDNGDIFVGGAGDPQVNITCFHTGRTGTWLDTSTLARSGMVEATQIWTGDAIIDKLRYTANGPQSYFMAPAVPAMTTIYGVARTALVGSQAGIGGGTRTWNPLDMNANFSLTGGDLTATLNSTGWRSVRCTDGASSGNKVFEFTPTVLNAPAGNYGIALANTSHSTQSIEFAGQTTNSVGWYGDGTVYCNYELIATVATFTVGSKLMMAIRDIAGVRLLFCRVGAGDWNANPSADPTTGVGGIDLIAAGMTVALGPALYPLFQPHAATDAGTANFGATAYANAAPAGFGNF